MHLLILPKLLLIFTILVHSLALEWLCGWNKLYISCHSPDGTPRCIYYSNHSADGAPRFKIKMYLYNNVRLVLFTCIIYEHIFMHFSVDDNCNLYEPLYHSYLPYRFNLIFQYFSIWWLMINLCNIYTYTSTIEALNFLQHDLKFVVNMLVIWTMINKKTSAILILLS